MQNLFSAFATGSRSYKMNPARVKCYLIDNASESDLNGTFTMRVIMIIIKYRHMQQLRHHFMQHSKYQAQSKCRGKINVLRFRRKWLLVQSVSAKCCSICCHIQVSRYKHPNGGYCMTAKAICGVL